MILEIYFNRKLLLLYLMCLLSLALPISATSVNLTYPPDNSVFLSNNAIFNCSGLSSDVYLLNMSLFTNISGSFQPSNYSSINQVNESISRTLSNINIYSVKVGEKITAKNNVYINSIQKATLTTATTAYLTDSAKVVIMNATFIGNYATFSSAIKLINGTSYYLLVDSNGTNFNQASTPTVSDYPIIDNNINWIANEAGNVDSFNAVESVNLSITNNSVNQSFNFNIPNNINSFKWNCLACDNNSVCNFASANRTAYLDNPTVTITSPSSTTAIANILVNSTISAYGTLDKCFFNITRGASLEVGNTFVNCTQPNYTVTLSSQASYILNYFANTSTGLTTVSSLSFVYGSGGGGGSSGGGGGGGSSVTIIDQLTTPPTSNLCEPNYPPLEAAYNKLIADKSVPSLISLWFAYWDYSLCKSGASLIPVD